MPPDYQEHNFLPISNPNNVVDALSRQHCTSDSMSLMYSPEGNVIIARLAICGTQLGHWQPQVSTSCPPIPTPQFDDSTHSLPPSSPFFPTDIIPEIPVSYTINYI